MRIPATIIVLILCSSILVAQHVAPLGKLLDRYYASIDNQEDVHIWVYFTDKGASCKHQCSGTLNKTSFLILNFRIIIIEIHY